MTRTLVLWGALLFCGAGAAQAQEVALPAKQAGVVRIGIVKPKVLVGTNDASQSGDSMRNILADYLQGPTIEVALLSARLPSQYGVEARQAECDYVLTTSLTHRRGSQGGGLGSAFGRIVSSSSYMPGMDYAKSAVVTGVLSTAADFAASVKAKDEMVLEYQLHAIDSAKPMLDKDVKRRAKTDGEDLLTRWWRALLMQYGRLSRSKLPRGRRGRCRRRPQTATATRVGRGAHRLRRVIAAQRSAARLLHHELATYQRSSEVISTHVVDAPLASGRKVSPCLTKMTTLAFALDR